MVVSDEERHARKPCPCERQRRDPRNRYFSIMRILFVIPVLTTAIPMSGQPTKPAEPTAVCVEKHATYTVASDGWPYAFLPDGDAFYLMVGGMTRAPKAFRYDSTGHKGAPRLGIDLTRRSTDMAAWRMEDGKIFNVIFGPPEAA